MSVVERDLQLLNEWILTNQPVVRESIGHAIGGVLGALSGAGNAPPPSAESGGAGGGSNPGNGGGGGGNGNGNGNEDDEDPSSREVNVDMVNRPTVAGHRCNGKRIIPYAPHGGGIRKYSFSRTWQWYVDSNGRATNIYDSASNSLDEGFTSFHTNT